MKKMREKSLYILIVVILKELLMLSWRRLDFVVSVFIYMNKTSCKWWKFGNETVSKTFQENENCELAEDSHSWNSSQYHKKMLNGFTK